MIPGVDGLADAGVIFTGCCPPDICDATPEALACNFINLLPNGPLWDEAKQKGIGCKTWCDDNCLDDKEDLCGSLVAYAAYCGRRLHTHITETIWPAVREASPYTAYDTLDEWLERLRWADCYMGTCRWATLGELTPYEILGECGPEYCPPEFPPELQLLYKRGVIIALHRMRLRPRKNLAALNFILSSLHSELVADPQYNPDNPEARLCLVLRPTSDFAEAIVPMRCPDDGATGRQVQLYITPGKGLCAGGPPRAYPLTLAAHCIVRALLPTCDIVCIKRKP